LEAVSKDLTPLAEQGNLVGFLANNENAQKISGLVEDINEAIIDYQVCEIICSPLP